MFKNIGDICLEKSRYNDRLFVPYCDDEEALMKHIYNILTQSEIGKKRLSIIVDSLDKSFLESIIKSIDAINMLGYSDISLEAHLHQGIDIDNLNDLASNYGVPIKIKYYLSSSDDNLRKRLEQDIRIRIDPDLVNLSNYQERIMGDKELSKKFKKSNRNCFVGEIVYELISDQNASLFECALLQYYASRYHLAVSLLGEDDLVDLWISEINKYSPNITILNLNNKQKSNKVLRR